MKLISPIDGSVYAERAVAEDKAVNAAVAVSYTHLTLPTTPYV